jgi:hypothetical protein
MDRNRDKRLRRSRGIWIVPRIFAKERVKGRVNATSGLDSPLGQGVQHRHNVNRKRYQIAKEHVAPGVEPRQFDPF